MKQLIMTKGLPGSGKSTWAKSVIDTNPGAYKRVNKDDLRAMLDNGKWSRDNEKFVLRIRDQIIVSALTNGKHVIVDDTNFAPRHEDELRSMAKRQEAEFSVQDFTSVPLDTCIERDLKRQNSVGETVIRRMYRDYLAPKPPVIKHDPALPSCVICDVDGTVALMNGRSPYDYSKVGTDQPNMPVISAIAALMCHYRIIFVSGRKHECRAATEAWLLEHLDTSGPLFMRADGDDRDDRIVKQEIYEREIKGKYNIAFVVDDRKRVVEKWRELGLTCFQVAEGDF
jgi:predicted kinase